MFKTFGFLNESVNLEKEHLFLTSHLFWCANVSQIVYTYVEH